MKILGKVVSILLAVLVLLLTGARNMLDLVGYATIPEDVEVARTRIEQAVDFLLLVPSWVFLAFTLLSCAWVVWQFWPDFSLERKFDTAVAKLKEENVKAWEFSGDYLAFKDEMRATLERLEKSNEELRAHNEEMVANLCGQMEAIKQTIPRTKILDYPPFQDYTTFNDYLVAQVDNLVSELSRSIFMRTMTLEDSVRKIEDELKKLG